MSINNENTPSVSAIELGTRSADVVLPGISLGRKSKLKSLKLVNGAGLVADNTNYVIVQLKKGSTVIGEVDTRASAEGALTALVAKAMPIEAGQEIQDGDLSVDVNVNGTGALTNAKLMMEYHAL